MRVTSPRGAQIRWRLRKVRPLVRRPVVARRHRGLRSEDVILGEYPKSGSTWLAFMLGELLLDRPIDFETQTELLPAVGRHDGAPEVVPGGRLLRTHEPWRREYRRAIYLVRHVGDVAVSYYNWLGWLGVEQVAFKRFLPMFLKGEVDAYGSWSDHVTSWLDARGERTKLVRYEDLKEDTIGTLTDILGSLGCDRPPGDLRRTADNNTVARMREKEERARATVFADRGEQRRFVRSGSADASGSWLDEHDLELVERFAGPQLRRLGYEIIKR